MPNDGAESPPGSRPAPSRRFVNDLFEWLAPRYHGALIAYSLGQDLRWKTVLVRQLHPRPGEAALDLACGTGLISSRLAATLGPRAVVGIDRNRAMLTEANVGESNGRVVRGDAGHLPFASDSFDVVTAGYLLKYVELEGFLREVFRVLKPGGRFGGYDFSRPLTGTSIGRLYAFYLTRVLPWLGSIRGRGEPGWKNLFDFLSEVARASGWESVIGPVAQEVGFESLRIRPSLGGAITWVWASRPDAVAP